MRGWATYDAWTIYLEWGAESTFARWDIPTTSIGHAAMTLGFASIAQALEDGDFGKLRSLTVQEGNADSGWVPRPNGGQKRSRMAGRGTRVTVRAIQPAPTSGETPTARQSNGHSMKQSNGGRLQGEDAAGSFRMR